MRAFFRSIWNVIKTWLLAIPTVGARNAFRCLGVLTLILGGLCLWWYWEDVKQSIPLLKQMGGKALLLCASGTVVSLLIWKKTRGFFWDILAFLGLGYLFLRFIALPFVQWIFIPTGEIPSLKQIVDPPTTAWFGDKLNDATDRTASATTPSSTPATPTSPSSSGGSTKTITLLRGHQYYLTCKTGDGNTAHHSIWMEDTPEWRFQVNSIRGFKPMTAGEVAALLKSANDIRDVGKVGTPRPVREIQQIHEGGSSGGDTSSPSFETGPGTDLLPPVDGLELPAEKEEAPPMPGNSV